LVLNNPTLLLRVAIGEKWRDNRGGGASGGSC